MNSINENLRLQIADLLLAQELAIENLQSQKDTLWFTLFYAQGASITAMERSEIVRNTLAEKESIKKEAVICSNISSQLLSSTGESNAYIQESISRAGIAAANVQVMANAILTLASDIGSVNSIINAADSNTDVFDLTQEVYQIINDTAYIAETASQKAMELSSLTASISAAAVLAKAKSNSSLIESFLKTATGDVNETIPSVNAAQLEIFTQRAIEKIAQGMFENILTTYQSAKASYALLIKNFNLDLKVKVENSTTLFVSFNPIHMPFEKLGIGVLPVKNYYLLIVKEEKKSAVNFSFIQNMLLTDDSGSKHSQNKNRKKRLVPVDSLVIKGDDNQLIKLEVDLKGMNTKDMNPFTVQDSDGEDIVSGKKYRVFLYAEYTPAYKKMINAYDDFLSSASTAFILKNQLAAVHGNSINISRTAPTTENDLLHFSVSENAVNNLMTEYRCVFLPLHDLKGEPFFNNESALSLQVQLKAIEKISEEYDPEITKSQATIIAISSGLQDLNHQLSELVEPAPTLNSGKQKTSSINESRAVLKKITHQISIQNKLLAKEQKNLTMLMQKKELGISMVNKTNANYTQPGFVCDLEILEQVSAGNYSIANLVPVSKTSIISSPKKSTKKIKILTSVNERIDPQIHYEVRITSATTDIFGNQLKQNHNYFPVIISLSTAYEENADMLANNWSGYQDSPVFRYQPLEK